VTVVNTYELITFNIQRPDGNVVDEDWRYNWFAQRSGDINDRTFYEIVGLTKESESSAWTLEPRATFKFLKDLPNETVQILANVQIIKGDEEVCISKPVLEITVTENECPECIPICGNIIRITPCIYKDNIMTYKLCCDDFSKLGIDAIEFLTEDGLLYNHNSDNTESLGTNVYADLLGPNKKCAYINVLWDSTKPTHILYARARRGEGNNVAYSKMISLAEPFLISTDFGFTASANFTQILEDEYDELILKYFASNILGFPLEYNIEFLIRQRLNSDTYSTPWSEWNRLSFESVNAYLQRIHPSVHPDRFLTFYPEINQITDISDYESIEFEIRCIVGDFLKKCEQTEDISIKVDLPKCDGIIPINDPFLELEYDCTKDIPEGGILIVTVTTTEDCPEKDPIPDPTDPDNDLPTETEVPCFDIPIDNAAPTMVPCSDIPIDNAAPTMVPCSDIPIDNAAPTMVPCFDIPIESTYTYVYSYTGLPPVDIPYKTINSVTTAIFQTVVGPLLTEYETKCSGGSSIITAPSISRTNIFSMLNTLPDIEVPFDTLLNYRIIVDIDELIDLIPNAGIAAVNINSLVYVYDSGNIIVDVIRDALTIPSVIDVVLNPELGNKYINMTLTCPTFSLSPTQKIGKIEINFQLGEQLN